MVGRIKQRHMVIRGRVDEMKQSWQWRLAMLEEKACVRWPELSQKDLEASVDQPGRQFAKVAQRCGMQNHEVISSCSQE